MTVAAAVVERRATVAGCTLGLAVGWNIANVGAVAEDVGADYGVALATVGLFTTALFVFHTVLQVPSGRAIDRFGARRIGLVSLGVLIAANALAIIASDPGLAIGARAVAGVGTALGFLAGSDYVREHSGSPLAQGVYGGVAMAAGGLALAVVPQAENLLEWRAPFVTAIGAAVLAVLVLAAGPRDLPRAGSRRHGSVWSVITDSRLYRLCVLYMATLGLSILIANWVVTLLVRAGGHNEEVAGAVGGLTLLAGLVSRPVGGWIARRHPESTRAIVGASLGVSALATAGLVAAKPLELMVIASLALGLASGIPFAPAFGAAARSRPDAPAEAVAVVNMAGNVVIVVGTPLLGLAFSLPGEGRIGFAVVAVLWIGALALLPSRRQLALR